MFQLTKIELGYVKVGEPYKLEFSYNEDVAKITSIQSPCSCTNVDNYPSDKMIKGIYTPKEIPIHLQREGIEEQDIELSLAIEYINTDGTMGNQILEFTAKVKQ